MSITNTTKENLKDEHNKHHQRKLLLSFLWWCLLCPSFKFSLVVFVMSIFLVFFGGVCYAHLLSFLWWCLLCSSFKFSLEVFVMLISLAFFSITNTTKENLKDEHNKHHQRKLKRWA
jgi:hypothetical protein